MLDAPPLALFLTWRTYGTWLPGDERGWVDERRNGYGEHTNRPDWRIENAARAQMRGASVAFDEHSRPQVDAWIRETCAHFEWVVAALNVRTNHVHLVVGTEERPVRVVTAIKAQTTKELRRAGLAKPDAPVWARGMSGRFLFRDEELAAAVDYVLNRQ
jgi:hypothetical protein